ncbi:MAG: hypothetical protein ACP5KW_06900 [Thermoproteota archaeon]
MNLDDLKLFFEFMTFEFEKTYTPLFIAIVLTVLIFSCPLRPTVLDIPKSTFEVVQLVLNSSFVSLVLVLFSTVTFSYSFAKDIEQGLVMDELTNPLRKETLFIFKFLINMLFLAIGCLISVLLSTWILFGSIYISAVIVIELVEIIVLLIYVSLSIAIGLLAQSLLPSIVVPLSLYFLEETMLFSFGYSYGITSPEIVILRLIFINEVTTQTWVVLLIHVVLASIVLVFSFFYFRSVMQLD